MSVLSYSNGSDFILSYYIIILYYYPLEAYLFSNEIEMGWIQMGGDQGEGLGGVEGRKP